MEVFDGFCVAWLTVCNDISSRGCANVIWREWGAMCIWWADFNWRYRTRHKQATECCPFRDSEDQIICASSKVLHQIFWCQGRIQFPVLILTFNRNCFKETSGACRPILTIILRTVSICPSHLHELPYTSAHGTIVCSVIGHHVEWRGMTTLIIYQKTAWATS